MAKPARRKATAPRRKGVHATSRAGTEGWKAAEPPRGPRQRRTFASKHGVSCFLKVETTKTGLKDYGYPICNKQGNPDCRGALAAFNRARQQKDTPVARKALRRGKQLGCGWAQRHSK